MRIGLTQRADEHERYAPDAWAGNIGKEIPVHVGSITTTGKLVSAVVAEDGRSVVLTVEVEAALPEMTRDTP